MTGSITTNTWNFLVIDTLPNAVDLLLQNIEQEMRGSFKKVTMITSWIFQYYKVYSDILAPIFVIRINLATVTLKKLNDNKIALVFYLQHQKNLEYGNMTTLNT